MTMNKDDVLKAFKKAPKPAASMKDWEKGGATGAGQQYVSASNNTPITNIGSIPHAVMAGFRKFG